MPPLNQIYALLGRITFSIQHILRLPKHFGFFLFSMYFVLLIRLNQHKLIRPIIYQLERSPSFALLIEKTASSFLGLERILMLISGAAMVLTVDARSTPIVITLSYSYIREMEVILSMEDLCMDRCKCTRR